MFSRNFYCLQSSLNDHRCSDRNENRREQFEQRPNNTNDQSLIIEKSRKSLLIYERIKQFYSSLLVIAIIIMLLQFTYWINQINDKHCDNSKNEFNNNMNVFNQTMHSNQREKLKLLKAIIRRQREQTSEINRNVAVNHNDDESKYLLKKWKSFNLQSNFYQNSNYFRQQINLIDCCTLFIYLSSLYSVYNDKYTFSSTLTISLIFMIVIKIYIILIDQTMTIWNLFQLLLPIAVTIVSITYLIQLDYLIKYYGQLFMVTPDSSASMIRNNSIALLYSNRNRTQSNNQSNNDDQQRSNNSNGGNQSKHAIIDLPPAYNDALNCPMPKYFLE